MVFATGFGAVTGAAIGAIWALVVRWLGLGDLSVGKSALFLAVAGGVVTPLYNSMRKDLHSSESRKRKTNVPTWSVMHPWATAFACAVATASLVLLTTSFGMELQQSWPLVLVASSVVFVAVGTYNGVRYRGERREGGVDR